MTGYLVFARKYRPQTLSEVVGQETLKNTLEQSMKTGKLPHAILLHGIRGVGKTTTARIIAKGLNCEKGPTVDPCGVCDSCIAISHDRHLDVIEMDAASHTGVDDVREVIETSRYKAVQGKYKIYIIDEVHMLSKSAFNALLKTLEEPPPFVHFIFATTEIQKVPDTVLSRCMRFDLNRMDIKTLKDRLFYICEKENIHIEEDAATIIARAADGSMRDALSLLDQGYALSEHKDIKSTIIRDMLGLSSKESLFDLVNVLLSGNVSAILSQTQDLFSKGVDPYCLLKDILDITYQLIVFKSSPKHHPSFTEAEVAFFTRISSSISMPSLLQVWQILSSQYNQLYYAANPAQSLQVLLLQVAYAAALPPLNQLLEHTDPALPKKPEISHGPARIPTEEKTERVTSVTQEPSSLEKLLTLLKNEREAILYSNLMADVAISQFEFGHVVFHPKPSAPNHLQQSLKKFLDTHTQHAWVIENGGDNPQLLSLREIQAQDFERQKQESVEHPLVQNLLETFPGARASVPE